jgi:hypothetical protein
MNDGARPTSKEILAEMKKSLQECIDCREAEIAAGRTFRLEIVNRNIQRLEHGIKSLTDIMTEGFQ